MFDPCSPEMLSLLQAGVEAMILGLIFGIIANALNSAKCVFFGEKWSFNRPESPWIVMGTMLLIGGCWLISAVGHIFS